MLLKRSVEVLVGAALVVALMLAVLPAVAEAKEGANKAATHEEKEEAQSAKRGAEATHAAHAVVVVVVRPGDSLWSISEEHLGPNATAQRIDRKTERIYALNRERIGADPNLILVGQELLVPSVGESSVGESSASSTRGSPAEGEATRRSGQTTRAQEEQRATEERATEANKAGQAPEQASEQAPERVTLPDVAAAQPVPAARPPTSDPISDPTLAVALVGWALLTVVLALVAWALLTVVVFLVLWALRAAEGRREARKMRTLRAVFGTNYTRFDPLLGFEETLSWRPPPASEVDEAADNDPDRLWLLATTRLRRARIQHGGATRGGRLPGARTTTGGVYNPDIRRYLRRAPRRANPKGSPSLTVAPSARHTRRRRRRRRRR